MRNWQAKVVHENYRDDIIKLREIVFKDEDYLKEKSSYWDWQFLDNHAGQAQLTVALDNNKVVGHYAVIPNSFKYYNNEVTGSLVVDVMTHPDYRKQGMFSMLGKVALENAKNKDIAFSLGYPIRKEVMPGHLKIGWEIVDTIPILLYPLNFSALSKQILNLYLLNDIFHFVAKPVYHIIYGRQLKCEGIVVKDIKYFDDEFDEFWNKIKVDYDIAQNRTANYLNWRYFGNVNLEYIVKGYYKSGKLVAFVILRVTEINGLNSVAIVDLHIQKNQGLNYRHIHTDIIKVAKEKGTDIIAMMLSKDSQYYKDIKRSGFINTPYKFSLIVYSNSNKIKYNEFKGHYHLMWGDTDVM